MTGTRAARSAGSNPPSRPIPNAQKTPSSARAGVTASWKLKPKGLADNPLNKAHDKAHPSSAPGSDHNMDSISVETTMGPGPKPMARKVASSRRRESTIAYREFDAQGRADRHDGTDEVAGEVQDGIEFLVSVFHDIALTLGLEAQGRIALDGVAERVKGRGDCNLTDTEL